MEGWFRDRPGPGLAEQIAAPLDLQDGVSLALIGGIGSGKSTELMHVRKLLMEVMEGEKRAEAVESRLLLPVEALHDLKGDVLSPVRALQQA